MTLREWMEAKGFDLQAVSEAVNAHLPDGETVSVSAVQKWKYGDRIPRQRKMIALTKATEGQVTANDFANLASRRASPNRVSVLSKAS